MSRYLFQRKWRSTGVLNENDDDLADGADHARGKIAKYFEVSSDLAICATILDPRYKLNYYSDDEQNETRQDHKRIIEKVWTRWYKASSETIVVSAELIGASDDAPTNYLKKRRLNKERDELKRYLQGGLEEDRSDSLLWWKSQENTYKELTIMARDILAIPATSAASERAFSTGRLIMPFNRCSLSHESMTALVCLRNWRKDNGLYISDDIDKFESVQTDF